jgi:hypothetical protein
MTAIAIILSTILVTTSAYAQQVPMKPDIRFTILPPLEYDYPYPGTLTIERGTKEYVVEQCRGISPTACTKRSYNAGGTVALQQCRIIIANDDILMLAQPWSYYTLLRHEIGHCNGWGPNHEGSRPFDAAPAAAAPK